MAGQAWDAKKGIGYSLQGGRWVYDPNVKPPTGMPIGSPVSGGRGGSKSGQTATEQKELNSLNSQSAGAYETLKQYDQAEGVLKRLKPGPFRGAMLGAAIPSDETGPLGKLAATVLAPLTRWTGAVSDQNVDDLQRIRGIQNQRVLLAQLPQKGVQTEGDAARMKLTDISPNTTLDTNMEIIKSGRGMANRARARGPFYTAWANKYGLNGVDEKGRDVEQAFQQELQGAEKAPEGWSMVK